MVRNSKKIKITNRMSIAALVSFLVQTWQSGERLRVSLNKNDLRATVDRQDEEKYVIKNSIVCQVSVYKRKGFFLDVLR